MPNLLRPNQVTDTKEKINQVESTLKQPHVQDPAALHQQLSSLRSSLDSQTPTAYPAAEVDAAVAREQELRERITEGMPTQAEMRKSPPGAVQKHINWETQHKAEIVEWKNLQLRLHSDNPDPDIANMEKFRPVGGAGEMNMDNALIPGKDYFIPNHVTQVSVMSEKESSALKDVDPELHSKMALLSNEQRAEVLDKVRGFIETPVKQKRKRKPMSDVDKKAFGKRMADARAAKAQKVA